MQQSVNLGDKTAYVVTTLPTLKTLPSQKIQSTRLKSLTKKKKQKVSKTFYSCTSR